LVQKKNGWGALKMPDITFIYPIAASVGALATVIGYHVFKDTIKAQRGEKAFTDEGNIPPEMQPEINFDGGKIIDSSNPNATGEGYSGKIIWYSKNHDNWDLKVWDYKKRKSFLLEGLQFGSTIIADVNSELIIGRCRLRCCKDATNQVCEWSAGGLKEQKRLVDLETDEIVAQKVDVMLKKHKESRNLIRSPRSEQAITEDGNIQGHKTDEIEE
jgi:hypothetical protein